MRGENVTGAHADRPSYRYRICVRGRLTGPLPDRAALYYVLAQIEALGLELLEVRRLPPA